MAISTKPNQSQTIAQRFTNSCRTNEQRLDHDIRKLYADMSQLKCSGRIHREKTVRRTPLLTKDEPEVDEDKGDRESHLSVACCRGRASPTLWERGDGPTHAGDRHGAKVTCANLLRHTTLSKTRVGYSITRQRAANVVHLCEIRQAGGRGGGGRP